jgi:hypothetical protein
MRDNLLAQAPEDPWDSASRAVDVFRRVVACHLAEMFIDGKTTEVRTWARGIAEELKREGVDIDDDIMRRLRELTLGFRPLDDHPF